MDIKSNIFRYNIIFSLSIWSLSSVYCILESCQVHGLVFYLIFFASLATIPVLLYRRYKPTKSDINISEDSILLGDKYIGEGQVIEAFEVNLFEKTAFAIKSPESDYSRNLLKTGLVVKTIYDTVLIDDINDVFSSKRLKKTVFKSSQIISYYILSVLPVILTAVSPILNIDPILWAVLMMVFIFFYIMRYIPAVHLGEKIDTFRLPLKHDELLEFKGIKIISGFILSDRLSVIPFTKPLRLEGLAVSIPFKKTIVLNTRLFHLCSDDYTRFVLFHELSHIKHHDGLDAIIVPIVLILADTAASFIPWIPVYFEYILLAAAAIYIFTAAVIRKRIEKRADSDAVLRIGEDGVSRIYNTLGFNIKNR